MHEQEIDLEPAVFFPILPYTVGKALCTPAECTVMLAPGLCITSFICGEAVRLCPPKIFFLFITTVGPRGERQLAGFQ